MEQIPFTEMFGEKCGGSFASALVDYVNVDIDSGSMKLALLLPTDVPTSAVERLSEELKAEFELKAVEISCSVQQSDTELFKDISYTELSCEAPPPPEDCDMPPESIEAASASEDELFRRTEEIRARAIKNIPAPKKSKPKEKMIYGKPKKGNPIPISELSLDSERCVIQGKIFAVDNKELTKRKAWVVNFDVTDYTNSIKVSKYFEDAEEGAAIAAAVSTDKWVRIYGVPTFSRYSNEIEFTPYSIEEVSAPERRDTAEEKRVELHLHTRFSTLDALTDPAEAVKQAAKWGHRAIGITDHGIVQAFPDAQTAGAKNNIKILYGVEGYYINNYDDRIVVLGETPHRRLDKEFVAFDLETTGLYYSRDRIIEIGAVKYKNGEVTDSFNTFVDPQRAIPPEITQLTGISDEDVAGAPLEDEAVRAFLGFVGDLPLAAHNADFDMSFISEACNRMGASFEHTCIDTLILAQNLMPDLKNFKLDTVSNALDLPDFNHHRASDDAAVVAWIIGKLFPRLIENGIEWLDGINPYMATLRVNATVRRQPRHIIIYAATQAGIKNLYKLVSYSHLKHFKKKPIIPKSDLMELRDGLIIGSACENGELFQAVVSRRSHKELLRIASFYDFLEIQPLCNNRFMIAAGKARDDEDLREYNRTIVRLGEELGKPVVATGDVHFLAPEDEIYRRILLAAQKYSDADKELPIYFKTTDEMLEEFSYLGEEKAYEVVVKNTNLIADMIGDVSPLPPKILYPPTIENSAEDLKRLVYDRMHELYGETPPTIVQERVDTELDAILGRGYDVIYMSAQKLVSKSLAAGYLVGSRGSVGSSMVAYMSGITEVNSLPPHYRCPSCKHSEFDVPKGYGCGVDMPDKSCPMCGTKMVKDGFDIPFETFLGFGGDKVPDIDLNFSGEYQSTAHRETINLFGADHVFRAGTIGTLKDKTAYGYVRKYLEERGITATSAEMNRLSLGCVGVKRTTGQHPGGLVVIPQDKEVYDFCPVQHPADDFESDIITTHFEYHCMEANLLKLDELGHDDPTMIKWLKDLTGVDAQTIPLDDPETMSIFTSPKALGLPDNDPIIGKTGTIAIPEFGTSFTREMLNDTQPDKIDILIRLSGFSHGTDVWLGNAKDLILSGICTVNEAIGCRDDIMLFLISKGMEPKKSFKIMEAVRKGKHLTPEWEEDMRAAGVEQWYIDSCNKIKYMFPKAHAVAYVMMGFRIGWYKVHCPKEFYCAYFSIRGTDFDATFMCSGVDAVRRKIAEIKANTEATAAETDMLTTLEVAYEFYMRGFYFDNIDLYKSEATRFVITEHGLRPPFISVPGLGETAALDLVAHRNDRDFISIEDLSASCTKVSNSHLEQLRKIGALGSLPETSQISLFDF